jgi:hypothetical protein
MNTLGLILFLAFMALGLGLWLYALIDSVAASSLEPAVRVIIALMLIFIPFLGIIVWAVARRKLAALAVYIAALVVGFLLINGVSVMNIHNTMFHVYYFHRVLRAPVGPSPILH